MRGRVENKNSNGKYPSKWRFYGRRAVVALLLNIFLRVQSILATAIIDPRSGVSTVYTILLLVSIRFIYNLVYSSVFVF